MLQHSHSSVRQVVRLAAIVAGGAAYVVFAVVVMLLVFRIAGW